MKNSQTTSMEMGEEIEVALDPVEPGSAWIVSLYES